MSVLVYTEINKGKVKKASLEAINYGAKIAELTGSSVTALVANADAVQLEEIGKAGAKNAAILAAQIIGRKDKGIMKKLAAFRKKMALEVEKKADSLKKR